MGPALALGGERMAQPAAVQLQQAGHLALGCPAQRADLERREVRGTASDVGREQEDDRARLARIHEEQWTHAHREAGLLAYLPLKTSLERFAPPDVPAGQAPAAPVAGPDEQQPSLAVSNDGTRADAAPVRTQDERHPVLEQRTGNARHVARPDRAPDERYSSRLMTGYRSSGAAVTNPRRSQNAGCAAGVASSGTPISGYASTAAKPRPVRSSHTAWTRRPA